MRAKYGLRVVVLALLSFFAVLTPHQARADANTIAQTCQDGYGTGAFDTTVAQQRSAYAQERFTLAHNINTMFPIAPALDACVKNLMDIFAKLPNLADPLGIAQAIINPILQGIISGVCSQVMGVITQAQSAVMNMTKICLPLPKFNIKLDLPTFSATSCTGGTQISPLTGFSSPAQSSYNKSQFQGH